MRIEAPISTRARNGRARYVNRSGYDSEMKNQNPNWAKLHPLATWNTMARIAASYSSVSGLCDFVFLCDGEETRLQPGIDVASEPFVDTAAAYTYLNAHTEEYVFLVVGETGNDGELGLADVVILVPGEEPISYGSGDGSFSYNDNWKYIKVVQENKLHRVKKGKLDELLAFLDEEIGCGMDLQFVPDDLYHSLDIGISMLEAVRRNGGSELVEETNHLGRSHLGFGAFRPFVSKRGSGINFG